MTRKLRLPQLALGRFFTRRTLRGSLMWGTIFGFYSAASALGFATAYPTVHSREALAASFGNNTGLKVLLGQPRDIAHVGGFTSWRALGIVTIVGAMWGLLLATRSFRGEEEAGRWEIFLAGRTTARRATAQVLAGIYTTIFAAYLVTAVILVFVGHSHTVGFSTQASLFYSLSLYTSAVMFVALGALASQIMPTRSRAASLCSMVFGIFFVLRAMGDISASTSWILNYTPLGWTAKLQPLTTSHPLWLLPIGGLTVAASGAALFMAGRRDMGESLLPDRDHAKPHLKLLRSPLWSAVRLNRAFNLGWLVAIVLACLLFGSMTKAATSAFSASAGAQKIANKLSESNQATSSATFLGIIFFIVMTMIMIYVAGAVGALREDEAQGYVDNFLVRTVSRLRWLGGRIAIIACVAMLMSMLGALASWAGAALQHGGVPFGKMVLAGVNVLAPAVCALGIGMLTFGWLPRFSSGAVYTVVAWSFLLQMLGSIVTINHWLLDTSVLHHMALAPATNPNWMSVGWLCAIGLLGSLLGAARFHARDLETE